MGVALQRIAQLACLGTLIALGGCAGTSRKPTAAELHLNVAPAHARVDVDEGFLGSAWVLRQQPMPLDPGLHVVTITASGHFPHHLRVLLRPGLTRARVSLRPIPP